MNNYEYPLGADNSSAPWRQKENKPRKVKVTVSQTVSTTLEITVKDYSVETGWDDELGYYPIFNYEDCNLQEAVKIQHIMPNLAANMVNSNVDWVEDDFEVILEE